ncbi:MAG: hypothetical protein H6936_16125 [Burkholderiales bacterium]|nr:hypothetical protein [Nitrosomonas sp.]MCP5276339.1 hypothetical protein [Burkholderiales bacterium]
MKEVNGWVIKLGGAALIAMLALPLQAQLMLAHEGHHDAGGCEIKGGEFPISFSGYEVPAGDIPPLHSFCKNIPTPGKVQLTIELSDWDSREIPLAVRLVEAGHGGHGGHSKKEAAAKSSAVSKEDEVDHSGHDMDEHEGHDMDHHDDHVMEHDGPGGTDPSAAEHGINYIPYMKHPSGIIVVSADLKRGNYEILLERKDDAGNIVVAGRVPFAVGGSGGGHAGHGGGFGMMEIGLVVIVVGGAAFYFMRRKKVEEESKS